MEQLKCCCMPFHLESRETCVCVPYCCRSHCRINVRWNFSIEISRLSVSVPRQVCGGMLFEYGKDKKRKKESKTLDENMFNGWRELMTTFSITDRSKLKYSRSLLSFSTYSFSPASRCFHMHTVWLNLSISVTQLIKYDCEWQFLYSLSEININMRLRCEKNEIWHVSCHISSANLL